MDFYDEEIRQAIASLDEQDRMSLLESLFVGMINTMGIYYAHMGYNDAEIVSLIQKEVNDVKQLLKSRISEIPVPPKPLDLQFDRQIPMDKSFVSDAKLDFISLINSVSKQK